MEKMKIFYLGVLFFVTVFLSFFLNNVFVEGYNTGKILHSAEEIDVTFGGSSQTLNVFLNDFWGERKPSSIMNSEDCYVSISSRTGSSVCEKGYFLKAGYKYTDYDWDNYWGVCCSVGSPLSDEPFSFIELDASDYVSYTRNSGTGWSFLGPRCIGWSGERGHYCRNYVNDFESPETYP